MDKSWMNIVERTTDPKYRVGVNEFLNFAYRNKEVCSEIPCPCKKCNNFNKCDKKTVYFHLMNWGITVDYDRWVYHGESYSDDENEDEDEGEGEDNDGEDFEDDLNDMLNNIGQSQWGENWRSSGDRNHFDSEGETLHRLFAECQEQLYPGCEEFSRLSFVVTLLHLKTISRWTSTSFNLLLDVFKRVLPHSASVPKNFYEAKKIIRDLGFHYEKIHACVNDCILFRNEYASLNACPIDGCREPRYSGEGLNVPRKVLRYFPIKQRLQRLFIDADVASDMRWHKEKRKDDSNVLRHPADSEAWKHLDRVFPSFAEDPRSVRLGLATDGFNPFGNMSNAYSVWPVFLVPYNLPPWKCMKDSFSMMSLLIPGPKSPGKDIDVYLQPLIDELNELWVGVGAYDAYKKERFTLRAAILWTINDFPAYSMLSGWSTKGYDACPVCMDDTTSQYLSHSRKMCYMGHRRFLPSNHPWRRDKQNFDGNVDLRDPIQPKDGLDILQDIDSSVTVSHCFGKHSTLAHMRKRKRGESSSAWGRKSIFFNLPYWPYLKLRHNIDIMHVVKNVTENVVSTIFDMKGKSKDTWKSRKDLMEFGLKKGLHLQPHGSSFVMPMASYHFTKDEKQRVLNLIKSLRFPDGFASNLSRAVQGRDFQLSRLKSHDFYIFVQRVMPLATRGCLTKEVRQMLNELSQFVQRLCSRTAYLDVLEKEEMRIALLLCKFERIFPPSFFDIMIHLLIHLPHEVKVAGPSQYRWMFPFERKMGNLKGYVLNKARPEGCIAERYIDKECLQFCSMYLPNVQVVERNNEDTNSCGEISVFSCKGRPIGIPRCCVLSEENLHKIHAFILNNCEEIQELVQEHKLALELQGYQNIDNRHDQKFASWFRNRVSSTPESYGNEIQTLSMGPIREVKRYSGCVVNGYRFHTQTRENNRKTQNSGVVVQGEHGNNVIDFYGVLKDVLEVQYLGANKKLLVFQCDWFDLSGKTGIQIDKDCELTSVNVSRKWYADQPYILASQARQVFYAVDIKLNGSWRVVQSISPRNLYDVPENVMATEIEEVYQEQEPTLNLIVDLTMDAPHLTRDAATLQLVDSSNVGGGANMRPYRRAELLDDSFIDDGIFDSPNSHSSTEEDDLSHNDISDSD